MGWLEKFISESNRIEGIIRSPTTAEIEAVQAFLELPAIEIPHLEELVRTVTRSPQGGGPGHRLRNQPGLDVRVGDHIAPRGGPDIVTELLALLATVNDAWGDPYTNHKAYEYLHPFTDGNGRSGRVLWLWNMKKVGRLNEVMALGFLHLWYYESLQ